MLDDVEIAVDQVDLLALRGCASPRAREPPSVTATTPAIAANRDARCSTARSLAV
jgi:hypothetical protein